MILLKDRFERRSFRCCWLGCSCTNTVEPGVYVDKARKKIERRDIAMDMRKLPVLCCTDRSSHLTYPLGLSESTLGNIYT